MSEINSSVAEMKAFAKRLRESLERGGITLTHSQALEATAHGFGYRDWNTASSQNRRSEKLFFISGYCDDDLEDPDLSAEFSYLVMAQDSEHAVDEMENNLQENLKYEGDGAFYPTDYYSMVIYEIDLNKFKGGMINWVVDYGSVTPIPHGKPKGVTLRKYSLAADQEFRFSSEDRYRLSKDEHGRDYIFSLNKDHDEDDSTDDLDGEDENEESE